MSAWLERSIVEHAAALARREYSSEELTRAYLVQIAERNADLCAYVTVTEEQAILSARSSDERRSRGESLGALDGIPFALKDNLCTKGIRTTCASHMLSDYLPPYDATVAERLYAAGGVLLGKLNMDEFAMGSSTEYSIFGPTKNPVDSTRVAGGSSGGSAAAVRAHLAAYTLGTDTGGSVRQPAAFCGVVGMKPTYGRVSRYGMVAFASSLDQIGPITQTVRDNALVLCALSGEDPRDARTLPYPPADLSSACGESIRGLRIGLPEELLDDGVDETVRRAILAAAERAMEMGAEVQTVSMPLLRQALAAYYLLSSAEASSNLARFDGIRYGRRAEGVASAEELTRRSRSEGFGEEVKRRILLGTLALSEGYNDAYYQRAQTVRRHLNRALDDLWARCDLLLSPTAPTVAYRLGEKYRDPVTAYRGDLCGVAANMAGIPAISIPCGTDGSGLPIGLQIMGRAGDERGVYRLASALEI